MSDEVDEVMEEESLFFVALGGAGEIGMNLNAYGIGPTPDDADWLVVDMGISFPSGMEAPGVEVMMADPGFLEERADRVLGILVTHAHEDHVGGVAHLWRRLGIDAPVWATKFTGKLLDLKLGEARLRGRVEVREARAGERFSVGGFEVEYVSLTHSIPEANGVVLRTRLGVVFHTGDWKLDEDPRLGERTDESRLRRLGDEGVLAMVCDSTNVFEEGRSGSEGGVASAFRDALTGCEGRVAVALFASNVARLRTAALAARDAGRRVGLLGRSIERMARAAKECGFLEGVDFVDVRTAMGLPKKEALFLCTGSQGEPRAALTRLAEGSHREVRLGRGDCVVFSSRTIPGNERAISRTWNLLAESGIEIRLAKDRGLHVSGHPHKEELRDMYGWVRPRASVPVHGEVRHLHEHGRLAEDLGVPATVAPNGTILRLAPGGVEKVGRASTGRLYLDGKVLSEGGSGSATSMRRKLAVGGVVMVGFVLGRKGGEAVWARVLGAPKYLPSEDGSGEELMEDAALDAVQRVLRRLGSGVDLDKACKQVEKETARELGKMWGKRPVVAAVGERLG